MKYLSIFFLAFFLLGASKIPAPSVPIGGTLAVFSNLPGTWQPPVSGAIKDGFMRADGAAVPASCTRCKIPAGTALPDLTDKMLRGSDSSGTVGGGDTSSITLTESHIPQMSTNNIVHQTVSGTFASDSHDHKFPHVHQWGYAFANFNDRWVYSLTSKDRSKTEWTNQNQIVLRFNTQIGSFDGLLQHSYLDPETVFNGGLKWYTGGVLSPLSGQDGSNAATGSAVGTSSVTTSGGSTNLVVGTLEPTAAELDIVPAHVKAIFVIRVY